MDSLLGEADRYGTSVRVSKISIDNHDVVSLESEITE